MPTTAHIEKHFTAGEMVRDIVIGMSDGLTVPFALAAGLSGAIASSSIVLITKAHTALLVYVLVTLIAPFVFGYVKGRFTGKTPFRSAMQTTLVGGLAAGAAFLIARCIA